jgi:hypothetical protein
MIKRAKTVGELFRRNYYENNLESYRFNHFRQSILLIKNNSTIMEHLRRNVFSYSIAIVSYQ